MHIDRQLDTRGLLCPQPVLEARRVLSDMTPGDVLEVVSNDPGSVADFPVFCQSTGHELVNVDTHGEDHHFVLRCRD